ncbi:MAG: RNA polymerase sigma factor [Armatimonadetes bacterium]|nr:RNA polymerase sigma factor [Armatimonadota bacterium]
MHDRFGDAELMEQIRDDHDPEAFRTLCMRWRRRLAAWFRPLLGDPAAVDDAVQEVLLLLWTRRAEYRATGRFEAYVLTLARHHWLNAQRRARRRETAELADDAVGVGPGPEAEALASEQQRRLARAVQALPAAHRQVLELATVAGLCQDEVAARLGLPLGTVKSRLYYARRKLRRSLEENDDAERVPHPG